ncbi:hypothetical protein [Niveispirillum irakense]|uniref:hypothetical protein n=1 Tax=Niveispirillum irakense TaxID=34011 RepID=UPI0012B5135E|nr:hypothetical protein [Niveispirillum irakense]
MKFHKIFLIATLILGGCAVDNPEEFSSRTPAFTKTYPGTNAKDFAFCFALNGNAIWLAQTPGENYRISILGAGVGSILAVIQFTGSPTTVEIREGRSINPGWTYESIAPGIDECARKITTNP